MFAPRKQGSRSSACVPCCSPSLFRANTAAPSLSAVVGVPYLRFAMFDFAGAALWAASFCGLGLLFSRQLDVVARDLNQLGSWTLLLFVAAFIAYIGYRVYERRRFLNKVKGDRITPEELKVKLYLGEPADDH